MVKILIAIGIKTADWAPSVADATDGINIVAGNNTFMSLEDLTSHDLKELACWRLGEIFNDDETWSKQTPNDKRSIVLNIAILCKLFW